MELFEPRPPRHPGTDDAPEAHFTVDTESVRVRFVHHPAARRYRLTLQRDGSFRCTLPRRGSLDEAYRFVSRCRTWIVRQLHRSRTRAALRLPWTWGSPVWFQGRLVPIDPTAHPDQASLGDSTLRLPPGDTLRQRIEAALHSLARIDLPARVRTLAAVHGFQPTRISIRSQRSRWGSCSRHGTISLNWRLLQCPGFVMDYIILHELAHLRHLNHSRRFWLEVDRICPRHAEAEAWLKRHGDEILV